ncbi:MAG TPA: hypothetical protein VE135_21575 [Pyrinomonadaceae bacterium]|nr:hypothetical protein [Pyrinomonadaceae bacterium]
MNTTRLVKHIKKRQRKDAEIQAAVEATAGPDRSSEAVRSWVVDFQQQRRDEALPGFDSLFKDTLPQSGHSD